MFGNAAVEVWRAYFERHGLYVVRVDKIEDQGAPMATREDDKLVLPDLQVFGNTFHGWVEIKAKTSHTFYNAKHQFRTGIEERLWLQYLRVEKESGLPGYLAMTFQKGARLMFQSLDILDQWTHPHEGSTAAFNGQKMVWWELNAFRQIDTDDDIKALIETTMAEHPPVTRQSRPWDRPTEVMPFHQSRLWDDAL